MTRRRPLLCAGVGGVACACVLAACNALVGNQNGVVGDGPGSSSSDAGPTLGPDGALLGADGASPCGSPGLDGDAKNCGRCGRDCLGGACVAGQCAPTDLGAIGEIAKSLTVDGASAYWASGDHVSVASLVDGRPSRFYTSPSGAIIAWVTAYAGRVAWIEDGKTGRTVVACDASDCAGTARTLASATAIPALLRGGPGGVFVSATTASEGYAGFVAWDGGPVRAISDLRHTGGAVELEPNRFDLTIDNQDGTGAILAGLDDGGGVGTRMTTPWAADGLAIEGDRFWLSSAPAAPSRALFRVSLDGGALEPVVPGVTSHVIRLVGGEAYYLAAVAHGVYRCRADACTPELLGSGSEFDANASFAAWQSDASGHLVRVVP